VTVIENLSNHLIHSREPVMGVQTSSSTWPENFQNRMSNRNDVNVSGKSQSPGASVEKFSRFYCRIIIVF